MADSAAFCSFNWYLSLGWTFLILLAGIFMIAHFGKAYYESVTIKPSAVIIGTTPGGCMGTTPGGCIGTMPSRLD